MMRQSQLLPLLLLLLRLGSTQAHALRKKGRMLVRKMDVFVDPVEVMLHTVTAPKSKKTKDLKCLPKHKKSSGGKGKTSTPTLTPAPTPQSPAPTPDYCPTLISACSLLEMDEADFPQASYLIDFSLAITGELDDVLETLEDYLEEEFRGLTACFEFDVRRRRLQDANLLAIDVDVTQDTQAATSESACPAGATCVNVDVVVEATHDDGDTALIGEMLLQAMTERCEAMKSLEGIADAYDPCPTIVITPGAGTGGVTLGDGTDGDGSTPGDGTEGDGGEGSTPDDGTGGEGSTPGDGTDGEGSTPGDGTDGEGSTPGDGTDGGGFTEGDAGDDSGGSDGADGGDGEDDNVGLAAVVDQRTSEDGVETGGYITIGVSALIILFVLLFAVRRRNEYHDSFSHKHLVNEGGDDDDDSTYLKGSEEDSQQDQRNVHVVGEADSVFSGWTGFSGERDHGGLYRDGPADSDAHQDVHKCSSATCELCEAQRRSGLQFVPTRMPSHSSHLPTGSSRRYLSEDTVHL